MALRPVRGEPGRRMYCPPGCVRGATPKPSSGRERRVLGRYIGGLSEEMTSAYLVSDLAWMLQQVGYLPPGTYLTWSNQIANAYFAWVNDVLKFHPELTAEQVDAFNINAISADKKYVGVWGDILEFMAEQIVAAGGDTQFITGIAGRMAMIPISEAPAAGEGGEVIDVQKKKEMAWVPYAVGGTVLLGLGWIVMKRRKGR